MEGTDSRFSSVHIQYTQEPFIYIQNTYYLYCLPHPGERQKLLYLGAKQHLLLPQPSGIICIRDMAAGQVTCPQGGQQRAVAAAAVHQTGLSSSLRRAFG
jgi:hypothetical protein